MDNQISTSHRLQLKIIITFVFLLLTTPFARGQDSVSFNHSRVTGHTLPNPGDPNAPLCAPSSAVYNSFFKLQSSYVPENGQTRPATVTKKIKLRFVIFEQNNTGPVKTNFRPSDTDTLHLMATWLNQMMSNLETPNNPAVSICGSCHVKDERLRVQLVDIDFVNVNSYHNLPSIH